MEYIALQIQIFLGGSDADAEGDWEWITGEPWTLRNDEPSQVGD